MPEQCGHGDGCSCSAAGAAPQPQQQPQSFAPHPYPVSGGNQPSWATTVGTPRRRRRWPYRLAGLTAAATAVAVAVLITIQVTGDDDAAPAKLARQAQTGSTDAGAAATGGAATADGDTGAVNAAADGSGLGQIGADLTKGAVFLQSNDQTANRVVAFARAADGRLSEIGRYPTGGTGTGSFEDSADGIVLGTADGEASPIQNITQTPQLLFVSNAGSGTVTVFHVRPNGLEKISETPSGGHRPVSLTVNNGLLYVLNSGEIDRRLILGPTTALENCAHDTLPSVTGFRVTPDGTLQAIPGSTRLLSGLQRSGCAQVSFTPDGRHLVVSERITSVAGPEKGALDIFDVQYDGTLGNRQINLPSGAGPFGFTFTKDGKLITSEQNGGFGNPGHGEASSYTVNPDGTLNRISKAVANGETDSCWITITGDQRLAYLASPFGDGRIASYTVSPTGQLSLQHEVASAPDGKSSTKDHITDGATDLALSYDSHYLYQLNSFTGELVAFKVNEATGLLSHIETHQVFTLEPFGAGGEASPFGIAVI
jgi:6-phosphogluconolactonase